MARIALELCHLREESLHLCLGGVGVGHNLHLMVAGLLHHP